MGITRSPALEKQHPKQCSSVLWLAAIRVFRAALPAVEYSVFEVGLPRTATAVSDVVQSGRPIFDHFSQHLWPYIGNNTANVVFQMVKRLWLIRIDQWL
ncbi:hypothetical protein TNCV_4246192 [Trichonephila clavipes]|nr:hypothetical protein TNCV_4246192 [Trichonephila clavipes]